MNDETKITVIENMVKDYEKIYEGLNFVPDVEARVHAANGIMVYLSKVNGYGNTLLPLIQSQPATVPSTAT